MEKTHLDGDKPDQLTNALRTDSDTSSVSPSDAALLANIETGLIVVGLMLIALALPRQTGLDGRVRYQNLLSLVSNHSLFQPDSKFSLIGPFFSIPLLLIGQKLGDPEGWICLYNLTLFSLCLLVSYFFLRNHIDHALLRKFFLVLLYGSMFVAPLALYFGEVFTALFVGFGVFMAFMSYSSISGWLAVVLGVANTPATLVGLGLLVLKKMFDSRRLRYVLVLVLAAICILAENWVRRGSIFNAGYANDHGVKTILPYSGLPGFSYPFLFGLLSILFSLGKGLLFFAPGLLLPIRKTLSKSSQHQKINLYQVYTLWICFLVGLILVYSRWWAWYGGVTWGPRCFLFASIPASFALAVRLVCYKEASLGVNLATFMVFCLSAWVSVDGAVFQFFVIAPTTCLQNHYATEMLCWYTPEYSALWMPFVFHPQIGPRQKIFLVFSLLAAAYIVTPLFVHLLRQLWDVAKKLWSRHMKLGLWRI